MSKYRRRSTKPPKDSDTYRPGPTDAQKRETHRKASAVYYARHPEVREKSRLDMQLRRAALKAKRRQWDPPKKLKKLKNLLPYLPGRSPGLDENLVTDAMVNGSIHFRDFRGATTASTVNHLNHPKYGQDRRPTESSEANVHAKSTPLTPDKLADTGIDVLATSADHATHRGGSEDSDSIIRMANLLSSHDDSIDLPLASVKPGRTVQSALTLVTKLNEGSLTPPTSFDASKWIRRNFGFLGGHYLEQRQWSYIETWRWHVEFSLHVWNNDTNT
ncbi:hypothetical protein B0H13DRAFT_1900130 [Mycena leptocephala]|nr:hypothetical protein B0H13DRAFT_1900130 [Mycena leptocephala]